MVYSELKTTNAKNVRNHAKHVKRKPDAQLAKKAGKCLLKEISVKR